MTGLWAGERQSSLCFGGGWEGVGLGADWRGQGKMEWGVKSSLDQSRALGREKRFQKGIKDNSWGGAVQSLKQIVQQTLEDWG